MLHHVADGSHARLRRRARAVPAIAALALACDGITDPPLPTGAERFAPPPAYARWWTLTQACSGLTGAFGAVQFYRLPGANRVPVSTSDSATAYWSQGSNRIVIAGDWANDGPTVRHEMLHALLRGGGHIPEYFQGRCAGVVACPQRGCRDEGAPPATVPLDAPMLPVSSLDLTMEVLPGPTVARSGADRAISLVVRATNPRPVPVRVALQPTAGLTAPWVHGFGYRLVRVGQPLPVTDLMNSSLYGFVSVDSVTRVPFAAGETRMWVIDVLAYWYPAAEYLAVGIFNARQVWTPLTVTP